MAFVCNMSDKPIPQGVTGVLGQASEITGAERVSAVGLPRAFRLQRHERDERWRWRRVGCVRPRCVGAIGC